MGHAYREHWKERMTGIYCDTCHKIRRDHPRDWMKTGFLERTKDGRKIQFSDGVEEGRLVIVTDPEDDDDDQDGNMYQEELKKELACLPLTKEKMDKVKRELLNKSK